MNAISWWDASGDVKFFDYYKMKTLLWLDDWRDPMKDDWLIFSPIGRDVNVVWVKSFQEFTNWIDQNGLPNGICFDHDLGDINNIEEKTGYDCAKYLVEYCEENDLDIPLYNIQSSNPVGKENIDSLLKQYHQMFVSDHGLTI